MIGIADINNTIVIKINGIAVITAHITNKKAIINIIPPKGIAIIVHINIIPSINNHSAIAAGIINIIKLHIQHAKTHRKGIINIIIIINPKSKGIIVHIKGIIHIIILHNITHNDSNILIGIQTDEQQNNKNLKGSIGADKLNPLNALNICEHGKAIIIPSQNENDPDIHE